MEHEALDDGPPSPAAATARCGCGGERDGRPYSRSGRGKTADDADRRRIRHPVGRGLHQSHRTVHTYRETSGQLLAESGEHLRWGGDAEDAAQPVDHAGEEVSDRADK